MGDPLLSMSMSGDSEVKNRLGAFNAQVKLVAWADRIGPKMASALREAAPVGADEQGGRLKNSIKYERSTSLVLGGVTLKFHTDVPYAGSVVEGSVPHPIDAVNAEYLRFPGKDGSFIFRKHVNHPGNRHPNRFNDKALEKMLPEIASSFATIFEEI